MSLSTSPGTPRSPLPRPPLTLTPEQDAARAAQAQEEEIQRRVDAQMAVREAELKRIHDAQMARVATEEAAKAAKSAMALIKAQRVFELPPPIMGRNLQTSSKEKTPTMNGGPPKIDWSGPEKPADPESQPLNAAMFRPLSDPKQADRRASLATKHTKDGDLSVFTTQLID